MNTTSKTKKCPIATARKAGLVRLAGGQRLSLTQLAVLNDHIPEEELRKQLQQQYATPLVSESTLASQQRDYVPLPYAGLPPPDSRLLIGERY